ncbi:MAG: glycosyltransferase family 4 protein [Chthoniobacterales bacterium]
MLRVAYLFERFPSFGQTFCYREVAELIRQSAEVSIFAIRKPKDEPPQDWDEAIVRRVVYLPEEAELVQEIEGALRRGELPAEAVAALKEWGRQSDFLRLYQAAYVGLRLQKPAIRRVHAHFAGMAARTAYWINKFFRIDFSVTAHANDIFAPRDFVVSLEKIFDAATAIVTVSDFAVAQLKQRYPANAPKLHRVYNGIEVERFRLANCKSPIPLIVSVGRLIEKKGFSDLIAACAELKTRAHVFRCEIVGEGPLQSSLERQIHDSRLQDVVALVGPRRQHQVIERLAAADVFVLPCTREKDGGMDNLPTVVMEAMAAGLPVISTPLAGVPEMVVPDLTGELVPERDVQALAAAIERLLSQPERTRELGRAGRALARERFSIEANVSKLGEIMAGG